MIKSSHWASLIVMLSLTQPVLATMPGPEDDRAYRAGIGLLNKGLNDLAVAEFRKYLDQSPDGE